MDCRNNRDDSWDRHEQNHNHLQKQSDFSKGSDVFCEVALNQEDQSYMFDEAATPSKACEGLAYRNACDNSNKESEEQRETRSALKRRRLLFDYQDSDSFVYSGEQSSPVINPNDGKDPFDEILPYGSHIVPGFSVSEDVSASSFEGLSISASEEWISECFNNPEMQFINDNLDLSCAYDEQIDVSEFLNVPPDPETEANVVRRPPPTCASPNIVIRERISSFASVPSKLPSSVVYPFAFIKPCGVQGDITLQDINQRIQTPRPKPKQTKEDPPVYQTSAFSGKPVVVKTKIHTEGGKGSITIMRTRG